MSDSLMTGIVLAMAGGFMDAYSYLCRNHVFSNAQTGNILLMGIKLTEGDFSAALRYLFPITMFAQGIVLAVVIRKIIKSEQLHWRQLSLFIELIMVAITAFIPHNQDLVASSILSLACGIQVQTFQSFNGQSAATTMCIGNLKSTVANFGEYYFAGRRKNFNKGMISLLMIVFFMIGAILGSKALQIWGIPSILGCALLLCVATVLMIEKPVLAYQ